METQKLVKISSITKKLLLALFGTFLLVFLLFHMCANLFILAHDDGAAYSAFCHFMGTNVIVKVFEIVLLGCFLIHICLATYLWLQNRGKRPVRYHQRQKTKTARGSKLAIISGSLLLVLLIFHFYDFYFVKINWAKGRYMIKTEEVLKGLQNNPSAQDNAELMNLLQIIDESKISEDGKWVYKLTYNERETIKQALPDAEIEPDFYHMAREKFKVWHIVLCYLIFFAVVGLHIRHGFESAFQTFGMNHHKYARLIEILGIIYCWVICVGFSLTPIGVFLGL